MWRNFQILKGVAFLLKRLVKENISLTHILRLRRHLVFKDKTKCISLQGPPKVSKENKGRVTTKNKRVGTEVPH